MGVYVFRLGASLIFFLALFGSNYALTPSSTINAADRNRFRSLYASALHSDDLETLAFAVKGVDALDESIGDAEKVCGLTKKLMKNEVSSLHYASIVSKKLAADGKPCQITWGNVEEVLTESLKAGATSQTLYHAITALKNLGKQVPKEAASLLSSALKADDTPMSYANVFYAATCLPATDAKKFHDLIEDIMAQADEVNDEYFQFDSGFRATASVIDSAYLLSSVLKTSPVAEDKVVKFANYLLDRKLVDSVIDASLSLSAIKSLALNKFYVPVSISLAGPVSISEKSPKVLVKVSDLMDGKIEGISVVAETARHISDNAVILSKKPLVRSTSDLSVFELDLYALKPAVGFYRIILSAAPTAQGLKLLGNQDAEIVVKVTTQVVIKDTEVLILDKEQGTTLKSLKVQHPSKVSVEADFHQKFVVKFTIADQATGKPISAHQTFVRLLNEKTKHDVIYIAEEENSNAYKFDLDVGAKGKDFNGMSGKYVVDIIVGDAVIENPFSWTLGDVKLTFSEDVVPPTTDPHLFSKKPEIKHLFREPEKRPPSLVSNFFTALVLVPFLILLILWIKLGANISNFPVSLPALGFHIGVGAIFGLYTMYFWKLNMFQTLKYLGLIGIPTFVCGQRVLSFIASKRK